MVYVPPQRILLVLAFFALAAEAEDDFFSFLKDVPYVCPLPLEEDKPIDSSPIGQGILDMIFRPQSDYLENTGDTLCEEVANMYSDPEFNPLAGSPEALTRRLRARILQLCLEQQLGDNAKCARVADLYVDPKLNPVLGAYDSKFLPLCAEAQLGDEAFCRQVAALRDFEDIKSIIAIMKEHELQHCITLGLPTEDLCKQFHDTLNSPAVESGTALLTEELRERCRLLQISEEQCAQIVAGPGGANPLFDSIRQQIEQVEKVYNKSSDAITELKAVVRTECLARGGTLIKCNQLADGYAATLTPTLDPEAFKKRLREACLARFARAIEEHVLCGANETKKACNEIHVPPGKFCIRSKDCVLMGMNKTTRSLQVSVLDCPQGFYCPGGHELPVTCAKGYSCDRPGMANRTGCRPGQMCILTGAPMNCSLSVSPLLAGTECMPDALNRTILAKPCTEGFLCTDGIPSVCEEGHMCPVGTAEPIECTDGEECPAGSKIPLRTQRAILEAAIFGVVLVFVMYCLGTIRMGSGKCTWRVPVILALLIGAWIWEVAKTRKSNTGVNYLGAHMYFFTFYVWQLMWGIYGHSFVDGLIKNRYIVLAVDLFMSLVPIAFLSFSGLSWTSAIFITILLPATGIVHILVNKPDISMHLKGLIMVGLTLLFLSLPYFIGTQPWRDAVVIAVLVLGFSFWRSVAAILQLWLCAKTGLQDRLVGVGASLGHESFEPMLEEGRVRGEPHQFGVELADAATATPTSGSAASASQATDGDEPESFNTSRPGISIGLRNLSLFLPDGRTILHSVTLNIPSGSTVAIMGPSGSGKSSITNVLSGRAGYGIVVGDILINGSQDIGLGQLRYVTGFVPQDDVMHRNLTTAENVCFQALLRLNAGGHDIDVETLEVLKRIGLGDERVANSLIGDENVRGISGGQRKRVSIAMEFIAQPSLLFLDEPTSGLDSTTSHSVIELVAQNAKEFNTTTLAVIHQPRYDTFLQFDYAVMLAANGYLAFAGKTSEAMKYFKELLGVEFEPTSNPADVFMDAITVDSAAKMVKAGNMRAPPEALGSADNLGEFLAKRWHKAAMRYGARLEQEGKELPNLKPKRSSWAAAMLAQVQRAAIQARRSCLMTLAFQAIMILGIIAVVSGVPGKSVFDSIFQPALVLFFVMLAQSVASHRHFGGAERVVAWRETGVGSNMVLYFLGRDMCALVEVLIGAVVLTLAYWPVMPLMAYHHTFFWAAFAYIYAIYGMGFVLSIMFEPASAQMLSVFSSFVCFLFVGVQPAFVDLAESTGGGIFYLMAFCPLRWMHGYLMREHTLRIPHAGFNNRMVQLVGSSHLVSSGLPLEWIGEQRDNGAADPWRCLLPTRQRWLGDASQGIPPISAVCSVTPLYMLGVWYRFCAVVWLLSVSKTHVTGGSTIVEGTGNARRTSSISNALFMAFLLGMTNFAVCMLLEAP